MAGRGYNEKKKKNTYMNVSHRGLYVKQFSTNTEEKN